MKNVAETTFRERAEAEGWEVSKQGWPDFFCRKGDRVMVVEVKPPSRRGRRHVLKNSQILRLEWLQSLGAECYVGINDKLIPFDGPKERAIWEKNGRADKLALRLAETV